MFLQKNINVKKVKKTYLGPIIIKTYYNLNFLFFRISSFFIYLLILTNAVMWRPSLEHDCWWPTQHPINSTVGDIFHSFQSCQCEWNRSAFRISLFNILHITKSSNKTRITMSSPFYVLKWYHFEIKTKQKGQC